MLKYMSLVIARCLRMHLMRSCMCMKPTLLAPLLHRGPRIHTGSVSVVSQYV